jgi:hypothetical protein
VSLHDVQVLDDDASLTRARLDDAALLAAVLAREHVDEIALSNSHLVRHHEASLAMPTGGHGGFAAVAVLTRLGMR